LSQTCRSLPGPRPFPTRRSSDLARSGYLIRTGTRASQALTLALLREGFNVGVTTTPLRANNDTWEPGTVVLRTVRNPDSLHTRLDRKSTRLNSSHVKISYAVFCL